MTIRLLIMAVDNTHPDPEVDRCCYKTGDIVAVRPAGWKWGRKERMPLFLRVDVDGMSEYEGETLSDELCGPDGDMLARRKFFCAQNIKPENQKQFAHCVANDDVYVTTKEDFIFYALQEREG